MKITGEWRTRSVFIDGKELHPKQSQKVRNHSPDGFSWGYGGSGPAQLALAIMMLVCSKEDAIFFYQDFKWEVIAPLPAQSDFEIEIDLLEWLNKAR